MKLLPHLPGARRFECDDLDMTLISLKQDIECDDLDVTLTLQEQAVEREQEREDFQKEIQHLQMVVKDKERQEGHENRLQREVSIRIQRVTHLQLTSWKKYRFVITFLNFDIV